ncbi:hypothetical protein B9Z55_004917 [Caenorhabditis nigoni]|nr:hypothetical protein B9Z55_004917 [Caenorhabditis nigoni]
MEKTTWICVVRILCYDDGLVRGLSTVDRSHLRLKESARICEDIKSASTSLFRDRSRTNSWGSKKKF